MLPEIKDPFAKTRASRVNTRALFRGAPASTVPTPEELGRRFRTLRVRAGLSLDEAGSRVGRSARTIGRFETKGDASAALLLDLIRSMSSATGFVDAFLAPKFSSIEEVTKYGRSIR